MKTFLAALLSVLVATQSLPGAATNEEQQLIAVLQSSHSLQEKDAACARLKSIGTVLSVPALSGLLTDEQLSHSARYALEPLRAPEAGRALIEALGKTTGLTRAGIINSIGVRGETRAVPALGKLLTTPDVDAGTAAAVTLGQIASPEALAALEAASGGIAAPVHTAIVDARLRCANVLLTSGKEAKALAVFKRLQETEKEDFIQMASYRGMILASGRGGLPLMTQAIVGQPGPDQTAALQLVHELEIPGVVKACVALLPKVTPLTQVSLVGALTQRNDPAAAATIATLARSPNPEVRLAVLGALGALGDAAMVPLLAETAASTTGVEQVAARQSLVELRRGDVTESLLAQLTTAKTAVQPELARALGERGESAAIPKLLTLAGQPGNSARQAALQALARLADQSQLAALVSLVAEAKSDDARADAVETLNTVVQRIRSKNGSVDSGPIVRGLGAGSVEARIALLPVCSGLIDSQVRGALRAAVKDTEPRVRNAGVRAICDTTDVELLPDLLQIASRPRTDNLRTLAIAGCVRLATQEERVHLTNPQRVETLKAILSANPGTEEKRLLLAGLAEIPDLKALKLVEPLLDEPEVQTEAARAAVKIAVAIPETAPARSVLEKALTGSRDGATRTEIQVALTAIRGKVGFITAWKVAGPYFQAGKDYAALFDITFPPEAALDEHGASVASATSVTWKPVAAATDPKRPWVMDLLKALGGEQRVAYVRTWIHCEQELLARLELGSDDGVKAWVNGKLVLSHNVSRALQPGSDKADVTLKAGWNEMLLKVTQNTQGWAFCARLLKPDGSDLEGLQVDADRRLESSAR